MAFRLRDLVRQICSENNDVVIISGNIAQDHIYSNTNIIHHAVQYILLHGKAPKGFPKVKEFPLLQILPGNEPGDKKNHSKQKNL